MTLRSQGACFLCMMMKIPGSRIPTSKNRQAPAQTGLCPRPLPSFLRVRGEHNFLREFQKSRAKKALPKQRCFFSLGLMREGHPAQYLWQRNWTQTSTDGLVFLGVKQWKNPWVFPQSQKLIMCCHLLTRELHPALLVLTPSGISKAVSHAPCVFRLITSLFWKSKPKSYSYKH